jgi:hypothetical protein
MLRIVVHKVTIKLSQQWLRRVTGCVSIEQHVLQRGAVFLLTLLIKSHYPVALNSITLLICIMQRARNAAAV